jgi:hypothetical protein
MGRAKVRKTARQLIAQGQRPRFHLAPDRQAIVEMPWLEFGGSHSAAIAEAARRAVAAELKVRPDEIELEVAPSDSKGKNRAVDW